MGYITSLILSGVSRTDGTTVVNRTFQRVQNVSDGFVLRETGVATALAASLTYRTNEAKTALGLPVRHSSIQVDWPYEKTPGDGLVAGRVTFNKNGLHVPVDCPANVRADVRANLASYFSGIAAGHVGSELNYFPLITGVLPF